MLTQRLAELGIVLPVVSGPFGAYLPARRAGDLVFVSGQLPMRDGKLTATGPVPSIASLDVARDAARQCVINALAATQSLGTTTLPGGIDALRSVVRVGVFVQSDTGFAEQPKVANGASEFLIELFGEAGKHVRAAVGTNALPLNASVEVEFIFSLV